MNTSGSRPRFKRLSSPKWSKLLAEQEQDPKIQSVRKRHVFFVPGYDPNAPRRYRELYRREGELQAGISGYDLSVARRKSAGNFSWDVATQIDGHDTQTTIELLTWQDIVRSSMARSVPATYLVMLRTIWTYAASGAFMRLVRLRGTPMLVAIYPVLALLLQLLIAVFIGSLLARFATSLGTPSFMAWGLGALAGFGVLEGFRRIDRRYFVYYLIHDYGFNASEQGRIPHALRARLAEFSARMRDVAKTDVDEVLVIGHSTGAQLACIAVNDYLKSRGTEKAPAIGFLTLGQVIPMQTFLPQAHSLRRDLAELSQSDALTWIDVSAPGDGACFALSDPVAVSGVSNANQKWPIVLSGAFKNTLSPDLYAKTKWQFFRRHIQYLCAFDRPADYDYFAITAGPLTLQDRFDGRASSPSTIRRVLSRYRGMDE